MNNVGGVASHAMVGRDAELASLAAAFERVDRQRQPELVLVSGAAGVGKSRLVTELANVVTAIKGTVLVGRCVEFGGQVSPLAPLRHMLQSLVDQLDEEALELVVGPARDGLSVLVPDLGGATLAGSSVVNVAELSLGVVRRLARRRPVLLVIEDLHWADASTLAWLSMLAAADWLGQVLVVGTFRGDELHRRHALLPVLAELARTTRPQRVELNRLDAGECRALVTAIGGATLDDVAVDAIVRRSGGVPFFLEELVLATAAGTDALSGVLREVILARTSQLDDESVAVLHLVSAASNVAHEVLRAVSGLDDQKLTAILDELIAAGLLVVADERIRFRHELGREVFEDEIGPGRRTRYHAALASALETHEPSRLGEIARHWSAAHDVNRAAATSIAAGQQAMRLGAPAEAEEHFGTALDLWDRVRAAERAHWHVDRGALLMLASAAAKHARRWDQAIEYGRRATIELGGVDANREGAAWMELSELFRHTRRGAQRLDAEGRALALLSENPPSRERARALANAAFSAMWDYRDADKRQLAARAIAVADACGDRDARVSARYAMSMVLLSDGEFERALASTRATLELCDDAAPESLITALNGLHIALWSVGDIDEATRVVRRGVEVARRTGLGGPRGSWMASKLVHALVSMGRWDEAEREARELRDVFDLGINSGDWGLAPMFTRQGRFDEAREAIERIRLNPHDDPDGVPAWLMFHLEYMVTSKQAVDAIPLIDPWIDRHKKLGAPYLVELGVRALADQAEGAVGEDAVRIRRDATAVLSRWFACVDAFVEIDALDRATIDLAKAEQQRLNGVAVPSAWESIAIRLQEMSLPYYEAYVRYRCGQAHLAGVAGRSASARRSAEAQLTAAHVIAAGLGAAPLLADIQALARAASVKLVEPHVDEPPTDATPDPFGLTSREREILDLMAQGRTNGEIGDQLFISTRTASVHVSHILRKLGVSNRVEAASVAHRLRSSTSTSESTAV